MKVTLKISAILNLGLTVCLIYVLASQRWRKKSTTPLTAAETSQSAQTAVISKLPVEQPEEPRPFQWNQLLEAGDYRAYIKNLRSIGCPEPTIRDIVQGDADRAFSFKRSQLDLDGSGTGPWSQQAETQLVADLLGQAGAADVSKVSAGEQPGLSRNAIFRSYPLVLQNVNLDSLGLNEMQKQAVAEIRREFIEAIGGPNQDPNDPAYRKRWQKARPESDDVLKGMLGTAVFENYQLAAGQN